ncbi:hypothetical protein N0V93_009782 [Gnomoniopsis smithogilvyi]|uniref:N-acetyltransferase domain-containing protein n=1 Tax=Gnomoniopsis smithogilvyi TaxID=1191159 RepID=A0A9W8YMP5_9PEZI|nr:hypothetical protein N0V93_009782 [Gnomoniopsis smithogilvyi]
MASRPEQPDTRNGAHLSRATLADAPALQAMVNAAYTKYIPRIGRPPAPMNTDYAALIASSAEYDVHVLRAGPDSDAVVGAIILADHAHDDAVHVDNLVVDPAAQGRGYGRVLMDVAEVYAREKGRSALTLHTNEKMVENLGIYAKMGFVEVERRVEDGYHRVYFRKTLAVDLHS